MLNKKLNNIFEIDGLENWGPYYNLYVYPWQYIYQSKPKWSTIEYKTTLGIKTRTLSLLNALPVVSRRLTRIVLSENITSDNDILNQVIFTNSFNTNLRKLIEQSFALGYGAIKTYLDGDKDENGNVIDNFKIKFQFYPADRFIPLSYDNEKITEAVFIDKFTHRGKYYTKLEYHSIINGDYQIRNELYRSDDIDILGYLTPIEEVFGNTLSPVLFIKNYDSTVPLFTVLNNPIANNINPDFPISPSIFIDSSDTLKNLDVIYDSYSREFILGKRKIIVPTAAIKKVPDPETGRMISYYDANDEVYQAMNFENAEDLKPIFIDPTLRVDEHIKSLSFYLHILAMQIGLSPNTLTFDPETGIRTATEVRVGQEETARFVNTYHENLKTSIDNLVQSVLNLCYSYEIISTPILDYEIIIPDSVIDQTDKEVNENANN